MSVNVEEDKSAVVIEGVLMTVEMFVKNKEIGKEASDCVVFKKELLDDMIETVGVKEDKVDGEKVRVDGDVLIVEPLKLVLFCEDVCI